MGFLHKYKKDQVFWGYFFMLPLLIGMFFLNIKPTIDTILMSFSKSTGFGNMTFAGLANYQRLFADKEVWQSLLNTILYSVIAVPLTVILSMLAAVLMNQKIKGLTIYRTLYIIPVVAAPTAVAMIWKWLFNSQFGLINQLLAKFGIGAVNWLSNPDTAIYTVITVGVWSAIGYNMILLIAGLQEIPTDYYESAELDGAGPIRQFFAITLPLVSPTLFFVVVTTIINAFQIFDSIFMMIAQNSQAMYKTESLAYLFYKYSFILNDKGYGSAIVVVLLALILAITAVQMLLQKKWVHY